MPTSREALAQRTEQKDRLFEAALQHVPFDGWSRRTLAHAARDVGIDPATARRLFPNGGDGLLAWLSPWLDRQTEARLAAIDFSGMKIRRRIATIVRTRLEILGPHREALRRAIAAGIMPGNLAASGRRLWAVVDRMWAQAGDPKGDAGMSRYTRRALLAGVYLSTLLFWLDDKSEDSRDSWAFLDRRIEDVMRIGQLRGRVESLVQGLPFRRPGRAAG